VKTDRGLGTGFETSTGVWTCFHVIDAAKSISVEFPGIAASPANNVMALDRTLDAAIIAGVPTLGQLLTIDNSNEVGVGDPLVVIGSPRGFEQTLTEGILSGKRTMGGIEYLQLSAAVSPGSSGSPVFNKFGKVVGMVVGYLPDSQQINFALSAKSLSRLQSGVPVSEIFKSSPVVAAVTNFDFQQFLKANDFVTKVTFETLKNTPSMTILTESIPDKLRGDVTVDMVFEWVAQELEKSAARLKTAKWQGKAADGGIRQDAASRSLAELLQLNDDVLERYLYINITFMKLSNDTAFYTITLDCKRAVLIPTGVTYGSVWERGLSGHYGPSYQNTVMIRDAVQNLVRQFANTWVQQNH
jgi:hypothetical protein